MPAISDMVIQASGGGKWNSEELKWHINCKELKAVLYGLQALCGTEGNVHIRIMIDSITTVSYVREFGGSRSLEANEIAREIWLWAYERNIWLSAAHIPGTENTEADRCSREFGEETEWMLSQVMFNELKDRHFPQLEV
jgi:hypothetical protein